jgi:hypothetical protein
MSELPRLRHCTLIDDPSSNFTTLVVGADYFTLVRASGDREDFLRLKSLLDGRHTPEEISRQTGISLIDVSRVVDEFKVAGLLQMRSSEPEISLSTFLAKVEETSLMWRRQIGLHRIFGGLADGAFSRRVFIGLLIETYHYVHLLPQALQHLASEMKPSKLQDVVVEYAIEEMDHHLAYRDALSNVDIVGDSLSNSHPTVGTLSLVRNFESIGRRSELSLVCCLQLIEARKHEMSSAEASLRAIAAKYEMPQLVDAFIDHMNADIDLGHSSLLGKALDGWKIVRANDAHEAVNDMHDIKHCFDAFHESVLGYYRDISNYIPRPAVDFFAL